MPDTIALREATRAELERRNTREAAAYLNCSEQTLRNLRHLGRGPKSYKLMNRVYYDLADLALYIEQQKAQTLVGA